MEISFTCPHCHEVTLIGEEFVGQSGECRFCGRVVRVAEGRSKPVLIPQGKSRITWATVRRAIISFFLFCGFLVGAGFLLAIGINAAVDHNRFVARRQSSENNLRQIAIAMRQYHAEHGCLPRAYWKSATGERTLSWRVALLPYLEQKPCFDIIDVGKPWDSPENERAKDCRVPIFVMPLEDGSPLTDTAYVVITGPGTLFEEGKYVTFAECTDGPQNTILAVEVQHSHIHWSEPSDLDIRTMLLRINGAPGAGISSPWPGGAHVAFADGSVRFLPNSLLESTLRAMITRSGGETFQMP